MDPRRRLFRPTLEARGAICARRAASAPEDTRLVPTPTRTPAAVSAQRDPGVRGAPGPRLSGCLGVEQGRGVRETCKYTGSAASARFTRCGSFQAAPACAAGDKGQAASEGAAPRKTSKTREAVPRLANSGGSRSAQLARCLSPRAPGSQSRRPRAPGLNADAPRAPGVRPGLAAPVATCDAAPRGCRLRTWLNLTSHTTQVPAGYWNCAAPSAGGPGRAAERICPLPPSWHLCSRCELSDFALAEGHCSEGSRAVE